MAKYGLETETTVHLKGMQIGDSESDTGGGNPYDLLSNAICIASTHCLYSSEEDRYWIVVKKEMHDVDFSDFTGIALIGGDMPGFKYPANVKISNNYPSGGGYGVTRAYRVFISLDDKILQ